MKHAKLTHPLFTIGSRNPRIVICMSFFQVLIMDMCKVGINLFHMCFLCMCVWIISCVTVRSNILTRSKILMVSNPIQYILSINDIAIS